MTLWDSADIATATNGAASAAFDVSGVTFDSREVGQGDLFVALTGETTDGHKFLDQAFDRGAAGAIVSQDTTHPHVLVSDTFGALESLAKASRARTAARIVGVTGSAGKTGTKEALFAALDRSPAKSAHRSVKSYNNHTGVPLSLARMPAEVDYGVFEMGMNHPGELAHLTTLVRPHVAIVTAIAPAHAAFFPDESAIAVTEPGGVAIIPYDSPHRERLAAAAAPHAARTVTFGIDDGADVRAIEAVKAANGGTFVTARVGERELSYTISQPGHHWVTNSLAVLAAVDAVGGDLGLAGLALADLGGLAGRGARFWVQAGAKGNKGRALVIDEAYNANPASMRVTLAVLGEESATRRIAMLGEMREIGDKSDEYHAALAGPVRDAGVQLVILVGEKMKPLADALEGQVEIVHVPDAAAARDRLTATLEAGDAVLIKGSNGVGLSAVVAALASGKL
jgi:UDP-N-acetylmuramoyl-tripeptide--D-alanyl-D-alanine ligase